MVGSSDCDDRDDGDNDGDDDHNDDHDHGYDGNDDHDHDCHDDYNDDHDHGCHDDYHDYHDGRNVVRCVEGKDITLRLLLGVGRLVITWVLHRNTAMISF